MTPTDSRGPLADRLPPHDPPPSLEERVVSSLRQRGKLATAGTAYRTRFWWTALAVAASVALFLAGAVVGGARSGRPPATPSDASPRYALLLYGGRTESAAAEAERVSEYARWARGIAAQGRYVAGEKLSDTAREVTPAGLTERAATDAESVAGFFIVSAATPAEADSIARTSPHVRHGGKVVVRAIEPTR